MSFALLSGIILTCALAATIAGAPVAGALWALYGLTMLALCVDIGLAVLDA